MFISRVLFILHTRSSQKKINVCCKVLTATGILFDRLTMSQFSLSWDAYKTNICAGLSALQQNGEFVDMTLAADGHHVKVHQMVLSLASPYIKDIISSTQCQHPVIFLNKISYATLCAILEYIYTGEVLVAQENLNELIVTGKELHIKGLQDMNVELTTKSGTDVTQVAGCNEGHQMTTFSHHTFQDVNIAAISGTDGSQVTGSNEDRHLMTSSDQTPISRAKIKTQQHNTQAQEKKELVINYYSDNLDGDTDEVMDITDNNHSAENITSSPVCKDETRVQYTLSNQGSLQLILNRYVYCISYTSARDRRVKSWRCTNFRRSRCPAIVFTRDDVVIKRRAAHNHPFQDMKIMKKIRQNAVFSAIVEAESAKRSDSRLKKMNKCI